MIVLQEWVHPLNLLARQCLYDEQLVVRLIKLGATFAGRVVECWLRSVLTRQYALINSNKMPFILHLNSWDSSHSLLYELYCKLLCSPINSGARGASVQTRCNAHIFFSPRSRDFTWASVLHVITINWITKCAAQAWFLFFNVRRCACFVSHRKYEVAKRGRKTKKNLFWQIHPTRINYGI